MKNKPIQNTNVLMGIFLLLTFLYCGVFLFMDRDIISTVFERISFTDIFFVAILLFVSLYCRSFRWHLLMRRHSPEHDYKRGTIFYLAGFAYTATPGKVGELSRVVFYKQVGITANKVVASFIIERSFDLFVVLILAMSFLFYNQYFFKVLLITFCMLTIVLIFVYKPTILKFFLRTLFRSGFKRLFRIASGFYLIIKIIRNTLDCVSILYSLLLGFIAWSAISFIFVYFCMALKLDVEMIQAFSIYPISMLVGALSFIPGGVGTTEAAMVLLLKSAGVDISIAALIAVLVRICTLWSAMLIGIVNCLIASYMLKRV